MYLKNKKSTLPGLQQTVSCTNQTSTNYNALQVKLDRRFSNGFQYLACYCSMWKTGRDRADSPFGKTTMT